MQVNKDKLLSAQSGMEFFAEKKKDEPGRCSDEVNDAPESEEAREVSR